MYMYMYMCVSYFAHIMYMNELYYFLVIQYPQYTSVLVYYMINTT